MRYLAGCAAVLAALVALGVIGFTSTWSVAKPIGYWVVDDRTLGVLVTSGPGVTCEIARVEETAGEVRVRAECRERLLRVGSSGGAHRHEFIVELTEALADRAIIDGNGETAERCRLPRCE